MKKMTPEQFVEWYKNLTPDERVEYDNKGIESLNRWAAAGHPVELYEWGKIEQIADESAPRIIKEADAQGITTPEEVRGIIVRLLTDKESRKEIERDAQSKANEYAYSMFRREANDVLKMAEFSIEQLVETGVDYGPLSCLVIDGEEYWTLEGAVRAGIVDGWGSAWFEAAREKYYQKFENN